MISFAMIIFSSDNAKGMLGLLYSVSRCTKSESDAREAVEVSVLREVEGKLTAREERRADRRLLAAIMWLM